MAPLLSFHDINKKSYAYLIAIEAYIYFLGSAFFPWKIFNNVPIVNSLQFCDRFLVYLYIVPVIILIQFSRKHFKLGVFITFLLISISFGQITRNYMHYNGPSLTTQSYEAIGKVTGKIDKQDIKLNKQSFYYDYFPSSMPSSYRGNKYMSANGRKFVIRPQIKGSNGVVSTDKRSLNNGIRLNPQRGIVSNRPLILPVLGYRGLNYQTFVNGHRVGNYVHGMNLALNIRSLKQSDNIAVKYNNPVVYSWMVVGALIYDLFLLLYLIDYTKKS